MSELNIFQRINEVRKEVEYIRKDKQVQNYLVVTHDAVTSELRPSMIKHGIVIVPSQSGGAMVDTGQVTGKGTPITRYEADYSVHFVNVDKPEDRIIVQVSSHALDYGDKAPGKAMSYAVKMAMLKVFSIETGENEESRQDSKPKPVEPITGKQVEGIEKLIEESGSDKDGFLKFCKVGSVSDITSAQYPQIIAILEKKKIENASA